jgi:hypothetical protein
MTLPAKYDRNDLVQIHMMFPSSLTQRGPPELFGVTNYILDINVDDHDPAGAMRRPTCLTLAVVALFLPNSNKTK